jgi:hypothetical protein
VSESAKQYMMRRLGELKANRARLEPDLKGVCEEITPGAARWEPLEGERAAPVPRPINNTPILAARIAASGLFAALTRPSSIWFRLTTPDPDMAEYGPAKIAISKLEQRMRWVFSKSNFYQSLADAIYPGLLEHGFGVGIVDQDPRRIINVVTPPLGEAYLSAGAKGVDTIYRRVPMSVRQIVQRFVLREGGTMDWSTVSRTVKAIWDTGNRDTIVEIVHGIEPRVEFDPSRRGNKNMPWASRWIEAAGDEDVILHESGYRTFPGLCPRYAVRGDESYGYRCPGLDSLGDSRELQHEERRLAGMLDKMVAPPMKGSPEMKGQGGSVRAGDMTYLPRTASPVFEPAMPLSHLPPAMSGVREHIERLEDRIDRAHFVDLWLRILSDERLQRATATEAEMGQDEAMSQLAPLLERLDPELFIPAIDRTYAIMDERGYVPEFPPEMQGVELKIEFVSILHQAQKLMGLAGTRSLIIEMGNLAALKPAALDNLNEDAIAQDLADTIGAKPEYLLTKEQVAEIRAQRAAREQQAQQMEQAAAAAKATQQVAPALDAGLQGAASANADLAAESLGSIAGASIGGLQ